MSTFDGFFINEFDFHHFVDYFKLHIKSSSKMLILHCCCKDLAYNSRFGILNFSHHFLVHGHFLCVLPFILHNVFINESVFLRGVDCIDDLRSTILVQFLATSFRHDQTELVCNLRPEYIDYLLFPASTIKCNHESNLTVDHDFLPPPNLLYHHFLKTNFLDCFLYNFKTLSPCI